MSWWVAWPQFVTFCCPSIASGRIAGPRGKKAEGNDSCTREGKPGQWAGWQSLTMQS